MKIVPIALMIAAFAVFSAGSAKADGATYVTHPGHAYGASHNNYHASGSSYGPSKDNYNGTQHYTNGPKTGSPTQAYVSPSALASAVPY